MVGGGRRGRQKEEMSLSHLAERPQNLAGKHAGFLPYSPQKLGSASLEADHPFSAAPGG